MRMKREGAGRTENAATVRVCVLCETWISGGIESFLCNVLTRINHTGLELDIVVSGMGQSIFTGPLEKNGVRFIEMSGSPRRVEKNHRLFRKLLRARRYDVLHLNAAQGLSMAYLHIAKQEGIPVRIVHSHNTALRRSLTRPFKLAVHNFAKKLYTKDATELWACSRSAAIFLYDGRELRKHGFLFIPNGIDVERFRFNPAVRNEIRGELGLNGQFVVGNVGRLQYQKNQVFLLDVFEEILKLRPDSRLLLVGEGEDKTVLSKKVRRSGISDKVLFYGPSDHVERLLWAMDVFAFTSRFEGLGIAVVEAQASGLPVVCSEAVPDEAHITEHIQSVPLTEEQVTWARAILGASGRFPEDADEVKAAGFDSIQVSGQIEACYRKAYMDKNIR